MSSIIEKRQILAAYNFDRDAKTTFFKIGIHKNEEITQVVDIETIIRMYAYLKVTWVLCMLSYGTSILTETKIRYFRSEAEVDSLPKKRLAIINWI